MWTNTKLSLLTAGLTLGLYACAVGGGDGESDDPMDEFDAAVDGGALDSGTGGIPGAGLDSGPGGSFVAVDASVVDSSTPRDSSVSPADSSTPTGDAAAPLAGLGGLFGGLFGGGDAGTP